jgi:hypothetical protein
VLVKDQVIEVFKDPESYTTEVEFLEPTLVGIGYEPLFPIQAVWRSHSMSDFSTFHSIISVLLFVFHFSFQTQRVPFSSGDSFCSRIILVM